MLTNSLAATFDLNSPIIYVLYAVIVAFILALSLYYLLSSVRRAKKIGMDMGKIKKVITTSITFSILPAVGIGLGVVTLIGSLGIAFPAIRLSVIGSLQYETQMADGVATAISGSMGALLEKGISAQDFVTMAAVMTISIMSGPVIVMLFYKKIQPKFGMLAKKQGNLEGGSVNLGELAFQVVFIGMVLGYLAMSIASITMQASYIDSYYNFIAIIVACICMYVFDLLINKAHWKWLDSFATPLAMLIAMIVVAVISYFATQNGWTAPVATAEEASAAIVGIIA